MGGFPVLKIRKQRLSRGWSITHLTVLTGIDAASLSRLERGQIPAFPGWRKRLAEAFGMSEEVLFAEVRGHGRQPGKS
jgi:transcriptional regulator with XRE-family HTH domain